MKHSAKNKMYDLVIVGGGPAGVAAAVYASRKAMKAAIIYGELGGQSIISADIQNWIGTKSVSGFEFFKMFEEHLRAYKDVIDIFEFELVTGISKTSKGFLVATNKNRKFETKTILMVSGSRRKKLNVPGEEKLNGKGVVYCSTCDAPLFKDKAVAVIGGGNSGLEAALDLLPYAAEIYILEYTDSLKGDPVTQSKVKASSKVKVVTMAKTAEILGDKFVSGLRYEDRNSGKLSELRAEGVFIEVGSIPNSDLVKDLAELNKYGEIVVNHKTQESSSPGIWAAGDVSDVLYKQNNISAGDAIKAVLNIYEYLSKS